jgi:hypothetical protein
LPYPSARRSSPPGLPPRSCFGRVSASKTGSTTSGPTSRTPTAGQAISPPRGR